MQAHVLHLKIDILRHIVLIFRTPRNVCVDKIQSRHLGVFKVYTLFLWDFLSKWPAQRENVLRYMPFLIGFLKYMARAAGKFCKLNVYYRISLINGPRTRKKYKGICLFLMGFLK